MTTPRTRAIVSLAAALTVTLTIGACVRHQPGPALAGPPTSERYPSAIRFDNYAREHVHVYLISEQRQWLLGRVEPGARATLQIPKAALVTGPRSVQLAAVAGERITPQAVRSARATLTLAQPASEILSQRWTFAQGQLTSLALGGTRPDVRRE